MKRHTGLVVVVMVVAAACGGPVEEGADSERDAGCADVIDASATRDSDGSYTIAATVSSADTGWDKYADAWDVVDGDGQIIATRELAHPHENEQPFTRSVSGVVIAEDLSAITVRARDSVVGYCGAEFVLALDR